MYPLHVNCLFVEWITVHHFLSRLRCHFQVSKFIFILFWLQYAKRTSVAKKLCSGKYRNKYIEMFHRFHSYCQLWKQVFCNAIWKIMNKSRSVFMKFIYIQSIWLRNTDISPRSSHASWVTCFSVNSMNNKWKLTFVKQTKISNENQQLKWTCCICNVHSHSHSRYLAFTVNSINKKKYEKWHKIQNYNEIAFFHVRIMFERQSDLHFATNAFAVHVLCHFQLFPYTNGFLLWKSVPK